MRWIIILLAIFNSLFAVSQVKSIKKINGIIYNNINSKTLKGVNVSSTKTGNRTFTNNDGKFEIFVDQTSDTLLISHIGFKSINIPIPSGNNSIDVFLDYDTNLLSEVEISTGYQSISKERSTGSFTTIDNATFNEQVGKDVLSRLEAIGNGITVDRYTGGSAGPKKIMIRGQSTILGVKGPLIVVDNFAYNGDINNINPNDVESITILKDAAAASIWGTKAGNGVIVITTKKGKFNQVSAIHFNSNFSFAEKPDLSTISQISSSDFIDIEKFLFSKKFKFSDTSNINRPPFTPVYEILFKEMKGHLSSNDALTQIEALRNLDYRNELSKYFYQNSLSQQYSLNASGGGSDFSWLFSTGYDNEFNELKAKSNRINIQFNNIYRPIPNLTINSSIFYTISKNNNGMPGYSNLSTVNGLLPPYTQLVSPNGEALPVMKDYRQLFLSKIGKDMVDWNYYPLTDYQHVDGQSTNHDFTGNFGLNYRLYQGFEIQIKYQYENQKVSGKTIFGVDSYESRNLVNRFTQIDAVSGEYQYKIPNGGIVDISESILQSHQFRSQLNFDKTWGSHSLTAIVGNELRDLDNPSNNFRAYGYDPETLSTSNVDFFNSFKTQVPVGLSSKIPGSIKFNNAINRFVSFYSNAAYTFRNIYTLSISGRRDASNLFGVNTNDKWTPLWSAGFGYEVSKERFYNLSYLSYLKFRASYGISGNVDPSRVALTTINYSPYTNEDTQTPFAFIDRYGNSELKWEKIRTLNLGLDFETSNNRIKGTLEFYYKKGTDLFGPTLIDQTTGITGGLIKNVAAMKGKGIDVTIQTLNLSGNLKWNTSLNFNSNSDKTTAYQQGAQRGSQYISGSPIVSAIVNSPIYSIYSLKWMGLNPNTGDPIGYINGHNSQNYTAILGDSTKISDLILHGSAFPTIFGSIGNEFSWSGFSLSIRAVYKLGYYFRRPSLNYTNLFNRRLGHSEYSKRWQNMGDEMFTNVPSMIFPAIQNRDNVYNGSEINVERGDHLRLQYITLGYNFSEFLSLRSAFKSLHLYANLNNVGIIWRANKQSIDPEYSSAVSILPTKTFTIGIKSSF